MTKDPQSYKKASASSSSIASIPQASEYLQRLTEHVPHCDHCKAVLKGLKGEGVGNGTPPHTYTTHGHFWQTPTTRTKRPLSRKRKRNL